MYNSQNLPLEKKKILKKSLGSSLAMLFIALFAGVMTMIISYSSNNDLGQSFIYAILVFLLCVLITVAPIVFYQYLYYKFYFYNFEDDKAEIKKGVISNATGHVRYARIQNIYVDQDILDRILGLYDVHYETAGERSGFYSHVDGLNKANADKLVEFLNERVANKDFQHISNSEGEIATVSKESDDNDQRVFSRENLPLDNKVITSMVLTRAFWYAFMAILLSLRFVSEKTLDSISGWYIIFFILIVFLLSALITYIYAKIWFKNFSFKFDGKAGMIVEKVISVNNTYLYYDRIQNIDFSQGIINRLLGIITLRIETASEGSKSKAIQIAGLTKSNAEILKDFLIEKSQKYRSV